MMAIYDKPVCPLCEAKMTRAHIETEEGWAVHWLCDCEPDPEIVAEAERVQKASE